MQKRNSSDKIKKEKRTPIPSNPKKTLATPYFSIGTLPNTWRVNNLLNFQRSYAQSLICNGYSFRTDHPRTPKLPFKVPHKLKKIILDDWGLVNFEKAKVNLPRTPSVNQITTDYLEVLAKEVQHARLPEFILQQTVEFIEGLRSQFTQLIRSKFLFYTKSQIEDFEVNRHLGSPVLIFGLQHLLRYLIQIPRIFASYSYNYGHSRQLFKLVQLFLK